MIIGAGPVGLFAVFELGLVDIKCHVVDILDRAGGQCAELYPDKPIYDIPALPVVSGRELTERLLEQIRPFAPVFHFGEMVESCTKNASQFLVRTDQGTEISARIIVIASGGGSFTPKRLPLPEAERFEGKSLFYAVRQREAFRDKNLLIAGGGDSALDWLLDLQSIARSVALVHRRDEFRAAPDSVRKMRAQVESGKLTLLIDQIVSLNGKEGGREGQIESVGLKSRKEPLACDCVLAFYGLTMKPGPIARFALAMEDALVKVDTEKFETSQPGIFAIGDANFYPGKLKLILSGFHEAALMAQQAFRYVYPAKKLRFQYTTSSSALQRKLGAK